MGVYIYTCAHSCTWFVCGCIYENTYTYMSMSWPCFRVKTSWQNQSSKLVRWQRRVSNGAQSSWSPGKSRQVNLNAQWQTKSNQLNSLNQSSLGFQWVNLCHEYTSCCLCRRQAWGGTFHGSLKQVKSGLRVSTLPHASSQVNLASWLKELHQSQTDYTTK